MSTALHIGGIRPIADTEFGGPDRTIGAMPTSPSHRTVRGTLYHAPVKGPLDDMLLPLNELRTRYPNEHRKAVAKYRGREDQVHQPVTPLNCTWGDVVFLSPLDSAPPFEAIRESGRDVPVMRSWTIDAAELDPERVCIRLMRKSATEPYSEPATDDDYLPFTTATLRAVSRVTDAALTRLRNLTPEEPLLPWVDVPHVLHRGPIPLSLLTPPPDGGSRRPVG